MSSNLHLSDVVIQTERESFSDTVDVLSGSGVVARKPLSVDGEYVGYATYGTVVDEEITFNNKSFSIADSGYSGEVSVTYFAEKFFLLKAFSLFVSGVAQATPIAVQFLQNFSLNALAFIMRHIVPRPIVQKWFSIAAIPTVRKGARSDVKFNFKIESAPYCEKNSSSDVGFSFELQASPSSIKNSDADIGFSFIMPASLKRIRYRLISELESLTLSDMENRTLNDLIFEELV